jgi:O-6-methylguanine DNA methyltransferase
MERRRSDAMTDRHDRFSSRVLAVVRRIPPGRVATYGGVAALAGRPRAARAVGNIMRGCVRPDVPCHRVIASGGRLGGYGGHENMKRSLLLAEGVPFSGSRVSDVTRICWPARTPPALRRGAPVARTRAKARKS